VSRSPGVARRLPNLDWEIRAGHPALRVAGVDEVGRGCLAGPVVAAAVVLPPELPEWVRDIADSKMLRPEVRERLAPLIEQLAVGSAIGVATVEEIDRINIFHASHLAMVRAVEGIRPAVNHALIDGKFLPRGLGCDSTAIVKGDQSCLSIAAASIVAKVWRDRLMVELDLRYPGYGLAENKGYPTPEHKAALGRLGVRDIHRRSFAPVAAAGVGRASSPDDGRSKSPALRLEN
jgi:ribonuclease HII